MWITLLIVLCSCALFYSIPIFMSCNQSTQFSVCTSITFVEELLPGTIVNTFTFTDSDVTQLRFSIMLQGTNLSPVNYLSLNTRNFQVDLVIGSRIDREDFVINGRQLYFTVNANGSQNAQFTFYVNVIDIDDNPPVFLNMSYTCIMPELDPSASCANLVVGDPDSINSFLNLTISSSTTGSVNDFAVISTPPQYQSFLYVRNFTLSLNTILNYDQTKEAQVMVQAVDSANHTTKNGIYIIVIDVPSNPAIFKNLPYIVIMNESLPQAAYVMTAYAIDGDTGINSTISYSFIDSPFNQYFAINSTTGVITIANVIIRESPDILQVYGVFNLTILASKNQTINNNSTRATVSIQIVDINNSPAIFNQNTYNASILENSALGTPVNVKPQIIISDKDFGQNAKFSVIAQQSGNVSNVFDVFPSTGIYTLMLTLFVINGTALDYETIQSMNVTIEAKQVAPAVNVPQSNYATVTINIVNVNEYAPVFVNTSYNFSIKENSPMYTKVGTISATDKDAGIYGIVTYQLRDPTNKFVINATSGDIFVNVRAENDSSLLDKETVAIYYMFGIAVDNGGLMSTANIVVNLLDVLDNRPIFQAKIYYGRIAENSLNLFPSPLQVKATDADSTAIVAYSLVNITNDAQTFKDSFSINSTNGVVSMTKSIDRELLNQNNGNILSILVQAINTVNLNQSDFCIVQVFIEDVNDNAPNLTSNFYNASIAQNFPIDSLIIYINATDFDQANTPYSTISYKLLGSDATNFVIQLISNSSKGAIINKRVNRNLQVRTYNFTVEADDCGFPPLSSTAIVLITVQTFNSRNPVFNQTLYQFSVNENVPIGTVIGQVNATDADLNNYLTYSIITASIKAWNSSGSSIESLYNFINTFNVNLTTGLITTTGLLDRELVTRIEILVLVVDNAAQTANQTATATVVVSINDLNDNAPVFIASFFYLNILEDFPVRGNLTSGATGLFTTATDKDTVGVLTYNYVAINQSFIVDPVTGQLFLLVGLDREKVGFINFTVWCTDGVQSTNATVVVTVLDVNDNEPTFNGLIQNYTIAQNASIGTLLQRFNATDLDIGEHARVAFQITGGEKFEFAVSPDGNFTVANSLLLNPKQSYVIFVEVFDNPNGPYHLRSDKEINIYIQSVNTPPVFDVPFYQYIIPENVVVGLKLDSIIAMNNNPGQNGAVSYYLNLPPVNPSPAALSLFSLSVNGVKAQISINSSLQYKAGQYILILRAIGRGSPPLDSNCTLYINVTSINYYAPNFTNPLQPLSNQITPVFSIKENFIGVITNIAAIDSDQGVNGLVRYGLEPQDADNANFSINVFNGTLTNIAPFVRLIKGFYYARIKAYDLGTPSLSTYITIQIVILDTGDKPPVFLGSNRTINMSIIEGPQIMAPILNTSLVGFKIGTVAVAVSYNLGYNTLICYFMLQRFSTLYLVPYTGDLFGLQFFDRESVSFYQSGIKAVHVSQCGFGSVYLNTVYNVSDPSEAMLYLQIVDVNDNPPYFTQPLIVSRMPKGYASGSPIIDLTKYSGDVDIVSQGQLTYSIQGPITVTTPLNQYLASDQMTQFFTLNATSGILSISPTMALTNTLQGSFQMTIAVSDGKFTATSSFMTYLVSNSQRIIVTVQDYPSNVAITAIQIATYFSQQISVSMYLDGLNLCTNTSMNLIFKCTNVFMYGFNMSSNTVLDGLVLQNMLFAKSASMTDLTGKYLISSIMLASQNVSCLADSLAIQQANLYRLILIIIACICFLIILITCAAVYICRSNYQRKLKAYMTSSSDHTTVLKAMSIPGTNYYENSKNPFAGDAIFENNNSDNHEIVKKYGIPAFGDGLVLERSTFSSPRLDDESQIIDSTETIF